MLINKYLQLDQQTVDALAELAGKVVCIQLQPLGVKCYFVPAKNGIKLNLESSTEPDITINGSPIALARMHWQNSHGKSLPDADVEVSGDVSLGQSLQTILQSIDIDWEEHLSKLIGEVIAHDLWSFCKNTKSWCETNLTSAQHNLRDCLQEESRQLPPKEEVNDFLQNIDILRNDAERLFARWDLLEKI